MFQDEIEILKLVRATLANVISEEDMNKLAKKLSRRFENNRLKSPVEKVILAACVLNTDLPTRFFWIKEKIEELRREL